MTDAIDFLCMADHKYLPWLRLCLPALRAQHPAARVFIYDLTPEVGALAEFAARSRGAVHVAFPSARWRSPGWVGRAGFDFFWPLFPWRESLKFWTRRVRYRLTGKKKEDWMIDKREFVATMRRFVTIVALKPVVLQDAVEHSDRSLVFIDADAIVRKSLAPAFALEFDVAVTAEAAEDVVYGPDPSSCHERPSYPHRALNTGVVLLRNGAPARRLLDAWERELEHVQHTAVEQTALANLIYRHDPGFFSVPYGRVNLPLPGGPAQILNLPCRTYNFTKIKAHDRALPDDALVVHFVGSLKKQKHRGDVIRLLAENAAIG